MPFALTTIGLLLVITGARDTYKQFGNLIVSDFTGPGNFLYWAAAIGAIGAIGYYQPLKGFSNAFLALLLIVFVMKNQGVFDRFMSFMQTGPAASPNPDPVSSANIKSADAGKGDGGDLIGNVNLGLVAFG